MEDAAGFFANVFGGDRFVDYVSSSPSLLPSRPPHSLLSTDPPIPYSSFISSIPVLVFQIGEISIMKDMTTAATTMMSDEEKSEMEKQLNGEAAGPSTPPTSQVFGAGSKSSSAPEAPPATTASPGSPVRPSSPPKHPSHEVSPPGSSSPGADDKTSQQTSLIAHGENDSSSASQTPAKDSAAQKEKEKEAAAAKRRKMTAEQKEKLREQEKERRKVMEARVTTLTTKMIERLRPFVEAERPGEEGDAETVKFETAMRREAEDLKLESFGVEVSGLLFWDCSIGHLGVGCTDEGLLGILFCSCYMRLGGCI